MKGTTRKRGAGWEYQVDTGQHLAQRCLTCGKRVGWLSHARREACPKCGGPLTDRAERKLQSKAGFRTKREADQALRQVVSSVEGGSHVAPSRQNLADYLTTWGEALDVKEKTAHDYRWLMSRYVVPSLGAKALQDVRPTDLTALYARLVTSGGKNGRPLSPNTARSVHRVLSKALADATQDGLIPTNPAERARQPRRETREVGKVMAWTREQAAAFLSAHQEDRMVGLYTVALHVGLRRGELLALTWEDVDLEAGTITVRRNLTMAGTRLVFSTPKTANSVRTLRVGPATVIALREQRKRQAAERLQFAGAYQGQGLVFAQEDGQPVRPDGVSKRFSRLVKATDLPTISFHGLRHTAATAGLAAGVPIHVVSKRLGHASISITLDVYGHLLQDEDEAAAARLDAYLA